MGYTRRRRTPAHWWFNRMRDAVTNAPDATAPPMVPQQSTENQAHKPPTPHRTMNWMKEWEEKTGQ